MIINRGGGTTLPSTTNLLKGDGNGGAVAAVPGTDYLVSHQSLAAYRTAAAQDVIDAGKGTYSKPSGGIPKTDLASAVQTSLGLADSALQSFTETDPTVSAWAKQPNKPTYTKSEVGLGNVDNTSDATKKSNFTGSIASGNNGFVTGGDVYAAIGNVEAALAALR